LPLFGVFFFQKLEAGRGIKKQIFHGDDCTDWRTHSLLAF